VCDLELDRPIVFEPYTENRDLGGFILIDRVTNATVGAGLLQFALRRSDNVHWQPLDIDKTARASQKGQLPCVLWFTGLSGAGKSTIANMLEKRLNAFGYHTYLLDGDNVRHGLNKDLGFTDADRVENIRRVAEVSRLMVDAGLIVLVSFISPFRAERRMARELLPPGEFFEMFVDTPLAIAETRDPKGLYTKARRGELKNFTGIDSPYEPPERPEIRIDTTRVTPEQATDVILERLRSAGIIT
jgi:bifunctional enzyme CysN/CysC